MTGTGWKIADIDIKKPCLLLKKSLEKKLMIPLLERTSSNASLGMGKISIASICPSMDVIAIVNESIGDEKIFELCLYRLSWQKVWSWSPGKTQRLLGISWRPDGKVICAHVPSAFILIDVESGKELFRSEMNHKDNQNTLDYDPNSFLTWTQIDGFKGITELEEDQISISLPKLSNLPVTKQSGGQFLIKPKDPFSMQSFKAFHDRLNMLVHVENMNLHLVVYGVFVLCPLSLCFDEGRGEGDEAKFSVKDVAFTKDLDRMFVLTDTSDLMVYDCKSLGEKMAQLSEISKRWSTINQLMFYTKQTFEAIAKEALEWKKLRDSFQNLMVRSLSLESKSELSEIFANALLTGLAPEQFQTALVKDFGARKFVKNGASFDSILVNIQNLLRFYLVPCLQRLVIKFEDLIQFNGKNNGWYESLGISDTVINECLQHIECLYLEVELSLQDLQDSSVLSTEFHNWLISLSEVIDGNSSEESADKDLRPFDYENVLKCLEKGIIMGDGAVIALSLKLQETLEETGKKDFESIGPFLSLKSSWEHITSKPATLLGRSISFLGSYQFGDPSMAPYKLHVTDDHMIAMTGNKEGGLTVLKFSSCWKHVFATNLVFFLDDCPLELEHAIMTSGDNEIVLGFKWEHNFYTAKAEFPAEYWRKINSVPDAFLQGLNPPQIIVISSDSRDKFKLWKSSCETFGISIARERKLVSYIDSEGKRICVLDYDGVDEEEMTS